MAEEFTAIQKQFIEYASTGNKAGIIKLLQMKKKTELFLVVGRAAREAFDKGHKEIASLLANEKSSYPILKKYYKESSAKNLAA